MEGGDQGWRGVRVAVRWGARYVEVREVDILRDKEGEGGSQDDSPSITEGREDTSSSFGTVRSLQFREVIRGREWSSNRSRALTRGRTLDMVT